MGYNDETDQLSDMQKILIKRDQDEQESKSLTLDLETLNTEYRNLLVRYKQSVLDYTDYLNAESAKPCSQYKADSKGINQACYEEIWKKSGCTTTGAVNASNDWAKAKTLNELIYDSFLWATMTDATHRSVCYGSYESPYWIIGVGTDGLLYKRNGLEGTWVIINDDSAKDLTSICTGKDNKQIIATTKAYKIFSKPTYDSPKWQPVKNQNCCVSSVAIGPDGTLVGVGTDNKLWSKPSLEGDWKSTASPSPEWISAICIGPDGSIFCIGKNNSIWKKDNYKQLTNVNWQYQGNITCCVKAITIAPDGTFIAVGNDGKIYSKDSYTDLTPSWRGPYTDSCCVISITTIPNPTFSGSYSSAKAPNYNINAPTYVEIKGQAFWGTSQIGVTNNGTLQDCNASCASTAGCTGATYNKADHGKPICWLRGGDGSTIPALVNDYAIVPKSQQLLKIVKGVGSDLQNVNSKMQIKIDRIRELYGDQMQERDIQNYNLIGQHVKLEDERIKIHNMLTQYQNLENQEAEVGLFVTQNYYWYFLLFALAIFFTIILAYSSVDSNTKQVINNGASAAIVLPITIAKETSKVVNPYYVLFAIILLFTITYIYNQYYQNVYNNLPSAKKFFTETNILYIFIVLIIIIGIGSRFIK
jgi:hypothetical protein